MTNGIDIAQAAFGYEPIDNQDDYPIVTGKPG